MLFASLDNNKYYYVTTHYDIPSNIMLIFEFISFEEADNWYVRWKLGIIHASYFFACTILRKNHKHDTNVYNIYCITNNIYI